MYVTQHLRKWGNGSAVRLPRKVIEAAKLRDDQALTIHLEGRSIILTPIEEKTELTLKHLLAGVTPELVGGEIDWGGDQGLENYE